MPRPHPPEFRQSVVELERLRQRPIAKLAEGLGISDSCLRTWMVQADVDDGRKPGLAGDERAELVPLRRKRRVLARARRTATDRGDHIRRLGAVFRHAESVISRLGSDRVHVLFRSGHRRP